MLGSISFKKKQGKFQKKLKQDLGEYISEELQESFEDRVRELAKEKDEASVLGETTRTEVIEYTGLIGQTLSVVDKVFPGYESVKKREVPSPSLPPTILLKKKVAILENNEETASADSLTDVYDDYIKRMDPDKDNIFGTIDNCPNIANPDQVDSDNDGVGDVCDSEEGVALEDSVSGEEEVIEDSASTTTLIEIVEEIVSSSTTTEEVLQEEGFEGVEVVDLDNLNNETQIATSSEF